MASQNEVLAVKTAIELTLHTIEQRARLYRKLVVAVSVLLVCSVMTSMIVRSWWPLSGLLLIVAATAAYLALDARLVRGWIRRVFRLRDTEGLNLESLSGAMLSYPFIPPVTLRAMLDELNGVADIMSRHWR